MERERERGRERDDKEISLCPHQSIWSHTITSDVTEILR